MKNLHFKTPLIIGRASVPGVATTLVELINHLNKINVNFFVEKQTVNCLNDIDNSQIYDISSTTNKIDLIIVIGGDGSLINAAHYAVEHNLPIIGIHRGRLGFLTDIHPQELSKLNDILTGNFQHEERLLLNSSCNDITDFALNDVVLMPTDAPQMIEFETYINNELVSKQRADGLIIATPTGSTAYALSAGGPIISPGSEALTILPICPHTLSSRPLVMNINEKIEVRLTNNNIQPINMSCDGLQHHTLNPGDTLAIQRSEKVLNLIHPQDYNYFKTLREKLGWEKYADRT